VLKALVGARRCAIWGIAGYTLAALFLAVSYWPAQFHAGADDRCNS